MLLQEQPLATSELSTSFGSNHELYLLSGLFVTFINPYKGVLRFRHWKQENTSKHR